MMLDDIDEIEEVSKHAWGSEEGQKADGVSGDVCASPARQ
jgi:hypothetical protein